MSLSKHIRLEECRVQASGNLYLDQVLHNIRRGTLPSPPPHVLPPPQRINLKAFLRTVFYWIRALLVLALLTQYFLPSSVFSFQAFLSPRHTHGAFLSQDLSSAKVGCDAIHLAIQNSAYLPCDEMLPPLRDLATELSRGIRRVDVLTSHITIKLSPAVKAASNIAKHSHVLDLQPALHVAREYTRQALDSLHISLSLDASALSLIAAAHSDVQQALVNLRQAIRGPLIFPLKGLSNAEAEIMKKTYKEREDWMKALVNATQELQFGRTVIGLAVSRYTELEAGLEILEQQVTEGLGAGDTVEGQTRMDTARIPFDGKTFEASFLDTLWVAAGDSVKAQEFVDRYEAL